MGNKNNNISKIATILSMVFGMSICAMLPFYTLKDWKGQDGTNGVDGTNGIDGVNGKDGVDGQDGVNGTDGKDGTDGVDGMDGADGSWFYYGTIDPSDSIGNDKDRYLNSTSGDLFVKVNGTWTKVYQSKGEDGAKGDTGEKGDSGLDGEKGETYYSNLVLQTTKGTITQSQDYAKVGEEVTFTFTPSDNEYSGTTKTHNYCLYKYFVDGEFHIYDKYEEEMNKESTSGNNSSLDLTLTMKENGHVVGAYFVDTKETMDLYVNFHEKSRGDGYQDHTYGRVTHEVGTYNWKFTTHIGYSFYYTLTPKDGGQVDGLYLLEDESTLIPVTDSRFTAQGDGSYTFKYTVNYEDTERGKVGVIGSFSAKE